MAFMRSCPHFSLQIREMKLCKYLKRPEGRWPYSSPEMMDLDCEYDGDIADVCSGGGLG